MTMTPNIRDDPTQPRKSTKLREHKVYGVWQQPSQPLHFAILWFRSKDPVPDVCANLRRTDGNVQYGGGRSLIRLECLTEALQNVRVLIQSSARAYLNVLKLNYTTPFYDTCKFKPSLGDSSLSNGQVERITVALTASYLITAWDLYPALSSRGPTLPSESSRRF